MAQVQGPVPSTAAEELAAGAAQAAWRQSRGRQVGASGVSTSRNSLFNEGHRLLQV